MKKNRKLLIPIFIMLLSMLCLSYASVPIYRIFCKVTGYGGTVRTNLSPSNNIGTKKIQVRFNADVNKELQWKFYPEKTNVTVKTGEQKLAFYYAENLSNQSVNGMAVYNVTPYAAGKYFNKVACFCFTKQTLLPHQKAIMPISFFIDPEIEKDPETANINVITLSYTFFRFKDK